MTTSPVGCIARTTLPLAVAAITALAGCASLDTVPVTVEKRREATAMPAALQSQPIGDFSAGLRCMDNLLLDHGARDLSVMVEDLADPTKRVQAGTKDMLISAVSGMTQRSHAIRLVASGADWGRTAEYMTQAVKREQLAVVPQYALRGAISQLEGANSPGSASNAAGAGASVIGVDLTLLTTQDFSVVPGVASRNSVILFERGNGAAGRAEIRKFAVNYSVSTDSHGGQAQALRALAELSSIELFGRLAKVPYWTCLGVSDADEAVAAEISDWYDAMAARPAEIIKYFQLQLRVRRVYDGPIDGVVNAQLKDAVARYREALGLSREPKLSLDFFKAYLGADHNQLAARVQPTVVAAAPSSNPAVPLSLRVGTLNDVQRFARGEAVQLSIRPNRDAHVYCFLQDEKRQITRFFPNRFQRDSRVQPASGLQLPGAMRFEIAMNPRGVPETVACFATERDVLPELPAGLNAGDFDPLPVTSLDQVRTAFANASAGALAQDSFQIRPR